MSKASCNNYWTSESLLNLWEYTQGSDITNKWVVHFVIIKTIMTVVKWSGTLQNSKTQILVYGVYQVNSTILALKSYQVLSSR